MSDWFTALGEGVPLQRRTIAADKLNEMGAGLPPEEAAGHIDEVAAAIEADDPGRAIELSREHLDVTGGLRLLAYLCVDPAGGSASSGST